MTRLDRPIGIIAPSYGVQHGGVEKYVERLAVGLAQRGVAVEVVAPDRTHEAPTFESGDNIAIRRFATFGRRGSSLPSLDMARWLLSNANRYALVNAHNLHTWIPALTSLAARRSGVPFVLTGYWHGTGHSRGMRLLHVPYRPVAKWTVRTAAAVICNSDAELRLIRRDFGDQVKAKVIPVGIDIPLSSGSTDPGAPPDGINATTILSVGRLDHYKGTELVVRALRHLPSSYRLVLVGAGPAEATIAATAAAEGVTERVVFRGRCSDEEVLGWYRHAAACVSMSSNESFGLVVLEAASAGCPVVASDIDAHRELTTYVPPGRVQLISRDVPPGQIASAIETAVSLGRVAEHDQRPPNGWRLPSWERLVTEVLQVYLDVAR